MTPRQIESGWCACVHACVCVSASKMRPRRFHIYCIKCVRNLNSVLANFNTVIVVEFYEFVTQHECYVILDFSHPYVVVIRNKTCLYYILTSRHLIDIILR